jgi:hypothetical protein
MSWPMSRVLASATAGLAAMVSSCSLLTDLGPLEGDAGAADATLDAPADVATDGFRQRITVSASSGTAGAGYSIRIDLPSSSAVRNGARPDLSDVRVVRDGTFAEIDRVVDQNPPGENPAVWFALATTINPNATDDSYWLYWGAGAAAQTNPRTVFALYDDFSSPTLAPVWLVNDGGGVTGVPVTGDGGLVLTNAEIESDLTQDGISVNSALELVVSVNGFMGHWFGYQGQSVGDFTEGTPFALWLNNSATVSGFITATSADDCSSCAGTPVMEIAGPRWFRIERASTTTRYFVDGTSNYVAPDMPLHDLAIKLKNYGAPQMVVSWLRARPLNDPEPTVTLGTVENAP